MIRRLAVALAVVLCICVAVRAAAWLIAPLLPGLAALALLMGVLSWVLGGPRFREWRRERR